MCLGNAIEPIWWDIPKPLVLVDANDSIFTDDFSFTKEELIPFIGVCGGYVLLLRGVNIRSGVHPRSLLENNDAILHPLADQLCVVATLTIRCGALPQTQVASLQSRDLLAALCA